jgi:hypothetical protein
MFERTLDHKQSRQKAPQQSPSMHQTPFFVFPTLESNKLLTLPDAKLINGLRNAVTSHERNAIQIAQTHNLIVKGRGSLLLPKTESANGYGFVVEPAWKTTVPQYTDFTNGNFTEDHQNSLELHDYHNLVERFSDNPARHYELAFIRAFGEFVLTHHA